MLTRLGSAIRILGKQRQLSWALFDQAMVSLANFLTGVLAARFLGIEEFGRFTLMSLVIQFVSGVQFAIINAPMMSIGVGRGQDERHQYYAATFFNQIIFVSILLIGTIVGMLIVGEVSPAWQIGNLALPLAAVAAGSSLHDFFRRYFFTIGSARRAFIADFIRYVGQVALLFGLAALAHVQINVGDVLWILAFTASVGALVGLPDLRGFKWQASQVRKVMLEHWHFGKWLLGSVLVSWAQRSIFQVIAGILLGAAAVGAIKAVQMLMGATQIFLQGLENVVPVEATRRYKEHGKKALASYLKHINFIGGGIVISASLIFIVAPDFWLKILYGKEFVGYGNLVFWYLICYIMFFFEVSLGAGLRALHDTSPIFYSYCIGTVVAVVCAYPLTWAFGVTGNAAGAALVSLSTQLVLWRAFYVRYAQAPAVVGHT